MLKKIIMFLCITLVGIASAASAEVDKHIEKINSRIKKLEKEARVLKTQVLELEKENHDNAISLPDKNTLVQMGAVPVVVAPYISSSESGGVQLDPSGLIIVIPPYSQDLGLLKQRQMLEKSPFKKSLGRGLLEISGMVETQAMVARNADSSRSSDIDLTDFELHLNSYVTPWVTAFMAIKYDNANADNAISRIHNSRLFIDRAFITIGNLDKSPFYGTIGQRFVSFGQYDNYMVTPPLTRTFARIKARQISVSYQHPGESGFYASVFAFRGDTRVTSGNINQVGGSLGYEFKNDSIKTDFGIDYINNIADGEGLQSRVFNENPVLVKRVPSIAVHGKVVAGDYTMIAEYIGATTRFDASNMSFNGVGARPAVLNTAFVYSFKSWNKPSDIAIGYTQTKDALALEFPRQRFSMTYNQIVFKHTVLSFEYRRDKNYALTDIATAQGNDRLSNGGYSNTLTAQLVYFF